MYGSSLDQIKWEPFDWIWKNKNRVSLFANRSFFT
jgi:hypothetical protein